jgi:hypothetical protein
LARRDELLARVELLILHVLRRRPGARTSAGSATASRWMASSAWRCIASRRSISAAIGSAPAPPNSAARRRRPRSRCAQSSPLPG